MAQRVVADRAMRLLARALIHIFFRSVEVDVGGGLPDGPTLVVSNHTNGLVDGLLLIAELPRYPRPIGKATLLKIYPLLPLLRLAGIVPIHRAKDGDTGGNDAAFRTCRKLLVDGGVIAIFPEGISHDEASLQPLRTGAARIALGATTEGSGTVSIVPVGLAFDAKARFRSRALVTVGAPLSTDTWVGEYATDERGAVRAMTDAISEALSDVSADFESPTDATSLQRVADIVTRASGTGLPTRGSLAEREDLARRLARIDDAELVPLLEAETTYQRDLALLDVTDAYVAATLNPTRSRLALLVSTVQILVGLPVAAIGYVVHVLPYLLVKQVAKTPKNEGVKSTVKVVGCLFLFVALYVTLGVVVGLRLGALAGIATAVACPLAGYGTVRVTERTYATGGLMKATRTLRARRSALDSVRANRAVVVERAEQVVAVRFP